MFGFYKYKYSRYTIFFITIGLYAFILQKEIEAILLFIGFVGTRYMFPKTYHYINDKKPSCVTDICILISILIFLSMIPTTIPVSLSISCSVLSGFIISTVAYIVQDHIDHKKVNIYSMTESQLRQHCQSCKITDNMQEYVINKIINGFKGQQLADEVGCGLDSLEYYSKVTRKLLGIKKW